MANRDEQTVPILTLAALTTLLQLSEAHTDQLRRLGAPPASVELSDQLATTLRALIARLERELRAAAD
jgi:hypothetical protein